MKSPDRILRFLTAFLLPVVIVAGVPEAHGQTVPPPSVPAPQVPPPSVSPPSVPPAGARDPGPATAPPVITASVSPTILTMGRNANLIYQIEAPGIPPRIEVYPQRIAVDGLIIEYSGSAQRLRMSNGVRERTVELRYRVEPQAPGEYTIPPQRFRIDGQDVLTQPVILTVMGEPEGITSLEPLLQLSVARTEVWKGEPVPVQVTLLVHNSMQPHPPVMPQIVGTDFVFNRFDRAQHLDLTEINGELWRSFGMESVVTALHAGELTLGPAEIKAEFSMPFEGRRDQFGRVPPTRRTLNLRSNTIAMKVKALPEEGRPEGFTGAVGEFEIEATASPVQLNAGDPVAVEILVSGVGSFDQIQPPKPETLDGWRPYDPRVTQENRGWGTEFGQMAFTQVLVPEGTVSEVPPYVLHYFDPKTGRYVTKKSRPIALTIEGTFEPPPAADSGIRDFFSGGSATPPVEEGADILPHALREGRWIPIASSPAPVSPWLLHGAPAAVLALLFGAGAARRLRAMAAVRRQRKSGPRPAHAILDDLRRPGQNRRTFYRLVNEYLSSIEYHRRAPVIAGRNAPGDLAPVLESRDRWLYSGVNGEADAVVPRAEQEEVARVLARI